MSLTVTAAHTKPSFLSLIPFLSSLLNHSTAISRDSLSSSDNNYLGASNCPAYNISARATQKTSSPNNSCMLQRLHRNSSSSSVACVYISAGTCLPALPSNELFRLLGFMSHYVSNHNIYIFNEPN
jgi:hypothetical protein